MLLQAAVTRHKIIILGQPNNIVDFMIGSTKDKGFWFNFRTFIQELAPLYPLMLKMSIGAGLVL